MMNRLIYGFWDRIEDAVSKSGLTKAEITEDGEFRIGTLHQIEDIG